MVEALGIKTPRSVYRFCTVVVGSAVRTHRLDLSIGVSVNNTLGWAFSFSLSFSALPHHFCMAGREIGTRIGIVGVRIGRREVSFFLIFLYCTYTLLVFGFGPHSECQEVPADAAKPSHPPVPQYGYTGC